MTIAHTKMLERIARVLAGERLSVNGHGDGHSVGAAVDAAWRGHLDVATAVLKAMREPDEDMSQAGDPDTWERMVRAALGERTAAPDGGLRTFAPAEDEPIYQKPLG